MTGWIKPMITFCLVCLGIVLGIEMYQKISNKGGFVSKYSQFVAAMSAVPCGALLAALILGGIVPFGWVAVLIWILGTAVCTLPFYLFAREI